MSDPDNRPSRRPPTIDLKATEVADAAAPDTKPADSSGADPGAAGVATPEVSPAGTTADSATAAPASEASESAAAKAETATNASTPAPELPRQTDESAKRGGGLVANMLSAAVGAIVAAVIFGGALMSGKFGQNAPQASAPASAPASSSTSSSTPTPDPTALADAANATAAAAIAPLEARLDKIDTALFAMKPDPGAPKAAADQAGALQATQQDLAKAITESAAATKALDDRLTALEHHINEIAGASQAAVQQASAAETAAAQHTDANAATKDDLAALASRVAGVEDAVKALGAVEHKTASNDAAARLTIAAEALRATVARGEPYTAELAAVRGLGVSEVATAKLSPFAADGVPDKAALAQSLTAVLPAIKHALEPARAATGFIGRLEENAERLVRITPIDAPPGNEPHAILARLTGDAAREDIAAAAREIAALPPEARASAADWLKTVDARDTALAASRQIAADALSALSKPASQ